MIKLLSQEDFEQIIQISQYAFQVEVNEAQKERLKEQFKEHYKIGDFVGEQLAAKLHVIPFEVLIEGHTFKMGGVAGVASLPEYRRGGKVAKLIGESLVWMKEQGYSISLLYPFKISFYRSYGWEVASAIKTHKFTNTDLTFLPNVLGSVKRPDSIEALPILKSLYTSFQESFNGLISREESWWMDKVLVDNPYCAVVYNEQQKPEGYMIYRIKDRKMVIKESITLTEQAKKGLWNFVCQHDSMIDQVDWPTYMDDDFSFYLNQPNVETTIKTAAMARIVDAEMFLQKYPFKKHPEPIVIEIEDEHAPWNNGIYTIENGHVCRGIESNQEDKKMSMDINTLTAVLMGFKTPSFLYKAERISGAWAEVKKLEAVITNKTPYLLDFF